jgi:predicted Ser/Thr protein kinase
METTIQTIFLYGDSGTGKTYTATRLFYRLVQYAFAEKSSNVRLSNNPIDARPLLTLQAFELSHYADKVTDLVNDREGVHTLPLSRECRRPTTIEDSRHLVVLNLQQTVLESAKALETALRKIRSKAQVKGTLNNDSSSRAHTVYLMVSSS